jgi:hypothetical protein
MFAMFNGKRGRKRKVAVGAINEIWVAGVPENLPNSQLVEEVQARMLARQRECSFPKTKISAETILRAAGRRR